MQCAPISNKNRLIIAFNPQTEHFCHVFAGTLLYGVQHLCYSGLGGPVRSGKGRLRDPDPATSHQKIYHLWQSRPSWVELWEPTGIYFGLLQSLKRKLNTDQKPFRDPCGSIREEPGANSRKHNHAHMSRWDLGSVVKCTALIGPDGRC